MKRIFDLFTLTMFVASMILSCSGVQAGNDTDRPLPSIDGDENEEIQYVKDDASYRIVSYNVGVFSKYMTNSTSTVASMMKEIEADAMILNELDRFNGRHDTDQLADFADAMDWDSYFAKAIDYKNGEYGNGAAYRKDFKVVDKFTIDLPKQTGSEDRNCIVIEFEEFVLAGTHLDVGSEEDRVRGVQTITEELMDKYAGGDKPVFVCGDMNSEPSSMPIMEFKKNWKQISAVKNTYPSTGANRCIDYIFALKDTGNYTVTATDVCTHFTSGNVKQTSDHLPVYADIRISK